MQTRSAQATQHNQSAERATSPPWSTIGGATVLAIVAFLLGVIIGSAGSGDDAATDGPALVDQWGEAFVSNDPEALAALYADSGTFNCRAFDFTIVRSEIADMVMNDGTNFTEFKPTTVLVGDEIIAVEYKVSATSPSGEEVTTPLLAVFDVDRDGLIDRSMIDYNRAELFPDMFPGSSEQGSSPMGCAGV